MSRGSQLVLLLLLFVLTDKAFSQKPLEVSEGHNITLEVSKGHDVTLPCTTTEKTEDIKKVTVEWKRSDSYVLVFRSGKPYPDDQDPQFKNRAAVADPELKNGNLSLILRKTQLNDSGVYECRFFGATSRRKRATDGGLITSVTLKVTAFSQETLKVSEGDNITLEVSKGQRITLNCTTTEEIKDINKVTVVWKKSGSYLLVFRSGKPIPDEQDPQFKNRAAVADPELKNGNLSLILRKTQLNDSGVYECLFEGATSRRKRATDGGLITSVTLEVKGAPSDGQGRGIPGVTAAVVVAAVVAVVGLVVGAFVYKKRNQVTEVV